MMKIRVTDIISGGHHLYQHRVALMRLIFKVDLEVAKTLLRRHPEWAERYPHEGCYVPITEIARVCNAHQLTKEAHYWLSQEKGLLFIPKSCYEIVK